MMPKCGVPIGVVPERRDGFLDEERGRDVTPELIAGRCRVPMEG